MRGGQYEGWLPNLFVGNLLQRKTVGIVGAGRIGTAYARMMVEGHKCNLVYFDPYPNKFLDKYISDYNNVLKNAGEEPISLKKLDSVEDVLKESDVSRCHVTAVNYCYCTFLSHTLPACQSHAAWRSHACAHSPELATCLYSVELMRQI